MFPWLVCLELRLGLSVHCGHRCGGRVGAGQLGAGQSSTPYSGGLLACVYARLSQRLTVVGRWEVAFVSSPHPLLCWGKADRLPVITSPQGPVCQSEQRNCLGGELQANFRLGDSLPTAMAGPGSWLGQLGSVSFQGVQHVALYMSAWGAHSCLSLCCIESLG